MDLFTVYDDDDVKISVNTTIASIIEDVSNKYFRLSSLEEEVFIDKALDYVSNQVDLIHGKKKKLYTSSLVPIIHRNGIIEISEAYKVLDKAVDILISSFDQTSGIVDDKWKDEIELLTKLYYSSIYKKECITHVFKEKVSKVSGFCSYFDEEKILLFPFLLNENDNHYRIC